MRVQHTKFGRPLTAAGFGIRLVLSNITPGTVSSRWQRVNVRPLKLSLQLELDYEEARQIRDALTKELNDIASCDARGNPEDPENDSPAPQGD